MLRTHPRPTKLESALSKSPSDWYAHAQWTSEETRTKFFLPQSQMLADETADLNIFMFIKVGLSKWCEQFSGGHTPALNSSSVQRELRQLLETAIAAHSSDFKHGHPAGIQIGSPRQRCSEKAASEFITDSRVSSARPHIPLLFHPAPASGPRCNAWSLITPSMNHECKLINIIGADALWLQFHFPFLRSWKLGRYSGGTWQSIASARRICITK